MQREDRVRGERRTAQVSERVLAPLQRVLRWLLSLRDDEGRVICPVHKVEHTGKSAYVALLAARLAALDPSCDRAALIAAARQQGRRLVDNLVREGTSPCHTFRPGRHDPFNCSNSVIDGGACSDALAALVRELGAELPAEEREAFAAASLLHARTYLRYAVLDKGVPAQRAWGLTGLAGAHTLEADPLLEGAALEAVGLLEGVQHEDGSYPYHPLEWGAGHLGASDVSSYYQSRVTAFLLHSLEALGRDPADKHLRGPLLRGLDFLLALQGPDGVKCGLVEAKPWYWGAAYEVASHPFDVAALALGWRHWGRPRHAQGAAQAFRAWVEHLDEQGAPTSHHPGPGRGLSYQCPNFWAAHAAWIARVAPELDSALDVAPAPVATPGAIDLGVSWFPQAQLARVEDGCVVAWIRGARPGFNVNHGSPHGAGLIRAVRRSDSSELVPRCRLGGHNQGEWSGKRGLPSLGRGLRSGGGELRFSLWVARTQLRAGRGGEALRTPLRAMGRGVLAFAHSRVGSSFELAPQLAVLPDGVRLIGALAHRDGTPVAGSRVERSFRVEGDGLEVSDSCTAPGVRGLTYAVPQAAQGVVREGDKLCYRLA